MDHKQHVHDNSTGGHISHHKLCIINSRYETIEFGYNLQHTCHILWSYPMTFVEETRALYTSYVGS